MWGWELWPTVLVRLETPIYQKDEVQLGTVASYAKSDYPMDGKQGDFYYEFIK